MNAALAKLRELDPPNEHHTYGRMSELLDRLESKDGSVSDHTAKVGRLSAAIAARLGLGVDEQRLVELGALVHDVGKLFVPDRILMKSGGLNELEWAVMRRHAAAGERVLAHILDLPDILAVVRSHHERWDGSGYPDGKRAEEIPLPARIVAVADAFQAMIEPRPYRRPRSRAAALAEIVRESGRQFDPTCVEALRVVV